MNYNAIVQLVYDARKIARNKTFKAQVSMKGAADYVTQTDLEISRFIKSGLEEIAPGVAFVTEEEATHVNAEKRFILDPIDGTTNLVRGYNKSSVSLGYCEGTTPVFGVVFDPFSGEMFFAIKGLGAYRYDAAHGISRLLNTGVENYRGEKLCVSALPPEQAIIEFGAGSTNKAAAEESFALGRAVFEGCTDLRRICSTALSLCYIAAGRIDGYFERRIKPWDYAAASLILQEAGGKLSQWNGETLPYDKPSTIVAGTPQVYDYVKSTIENARGGAV
ncbi:MAG: inositol monophosphatase [Clostridia bacterium]|nr:inositol monophosphatase [Clostridia bacterium]